MKIERVTNTLAAWSARPGALHSRLRGALEEAIRQGNLLPGTRLPAERVLARALAISRTTVVSSYNELRSEGWIESRTGSGTWVSRSKASAARASAHAGLISRSVLLNLLVAKESGAVDFAVASPEPLDELVESAYAAVGSQASDLLASRDYMPFGLPMLREAIASHYTALGTPTEAAQVLITTGAQQAIFLISTMFVQRGDVVAVENPTYFGALEIFRLAGARLAPLPIGQQHISPGTLAQRIATASPRLIYLNATAQNPTGVVMPESARREIARAADGHGIPIIEDETLAPTVFSRQTPRSIAAFANGGNILTIGSLSKLFCPGLRVGWIRGPEAVIARLAKLRSAIDLGSPLITQAIGAELFASFDVARAIRQAQLRPRRDLLARLLRTSLPEAEFRDPDGGLSLWVRLPGVDTRALAQVALRHGLAFAPGSMFSVDESHTEYMRLPFLLEPAEIEEGVSRLVAAWREFARSQPQSHRVAEPVMV